MVAPPVPIPNTEVKRLSSDGSASIGCARVGRCQNYARQAHSELAGLFLFVFGTVGKCYEIFTRSDFKIGKRGVARNFGARQEAGIIEPFNSLSLTASAKKDLAAFPKSDSKATLRTHQIPLPLPLRPNEIVEIRAKFHASQAVFAAYLGVSKAAVVAWERGQRKPSGAALRLLTIIWKNPEILLNGVKNGYSPSF